MEQHPKKRLTRADLALEWGPGKYARERHELTTSASAQGRKRKRAGLSSLAAAAYRLGVMNSSRIMAHVCAREVDAP